MYTIMYGNRCKCYKNCTHSYVITVLRDDVEVASMWRSGGMLPDEYTPSEEVYEKALDALADDCWRERATAALAD